MVPSSFHKSSQSSKLEVATMTLGAVLQNRTGPPNWNRPLLIALRIKFFVKKSRKKRNGGAAAPQKICLDKTAVHHYANENKKMCFFCGGRQPRQGCGSSPFRPGRTAWPIFRRPAAGRYEAPLPDDEQ
jgi:hypothetical protein